MACYKILSLSVQEKTNIMYYQRITNANLFTYHIENILGSQDKTRDTHFSLSTHNNKIAVEAWLHTESVR